MRATEGYTHALRAARRLVPMNRAMIVTAPLGAAVWERIGWDGAETLRDAAHVYCYLQRTADGRIAIGGRGVPVPLRLAHRPPRRDRAARPSNELRARLTRLFPGSATSRLDHAWAGVLGVARDWCPSVGADPATGIAGRRLRRRRRLDRQPRRPHARATSCSERDTALTRGCRGCGTARRAGSRSRCGSSASARVYALYRAADAHEERTAPPVAARPLWPTRIAGR